MAKRFPVVSWAKGCSLYEVNIRQYTAEGTFAAFEKHLPRLQEMGIEVLWLMPVTPISLEKRQGTLGSYYACSSYTAINPEFGTLDDFKKLVAAVHARGMKLIIDWVANHTGWDHHWKTEHPEWFHKNEKGAFYDKNGWVDVIDLDHSNAAMRKELVAAMQYWITECNIDGFRCDMAHLVPLYFWTEARAACDAIKPLFWLAETDNTEYHEVFDCSYAWSWMHTSEKLMKGETGLHEFKNQLQKCTELPGDSYKLLFTSNHDENSWNGTEYEKYGDAAKALAVLCCTFKALPLIYSGQELPNKKRLKFFDKDEIAWNEAPALHAFYQSLLHLRHHSNAVRYGEVQFLPTNEENKVLAYVRKHEERTVLVLLNLSASEKITVKIQHPDFSGRFTSVYSGLSYQFKQEMEFELEAWGYLIYQQ